MFERLKTITLTVLVLLSLIQTYVLVYRTPQFEQAVQSDYVQTEQADTLLELPQLLQPRMIIAHLGAEAHSVFYPQTPEYDNMVATWRQFSYENLQKTDMTLAQFYEAREQRLAMSIQFEQELELETIQAWLNLKTETELELQPSFDVMFVAPNVPDNKMDVWLVSHANGYVYKCLETDLTETEFTELMVNASLQTVYRTYGKRYFVPEQANGWPVYQVAYEKVATESLWQRLFIDPNITRNLTERDGTKIYTDGKRGLQIKNNGRYMVFSDPVAQQNFRGSSLESMRNGVQFINKHGGWSGDFKLRGLSVNEADGESVYEFRQYFGSLPLVHRVDSWFGYTRLKMKGGTVAGYQRPMIELSSQAKKVKDVSLIAGEPLLLRLEELQKMGPLRAFEPVYDVQWLDEGVRLTPVWAVQSNDGKWTYIQ